MIQIPKFDEVSKFNGKEIPEDNIISQLQHYYTAGPASDRVLEGSAGAKRR